MARGRFIVIEGLDGAGSTTQAELLQAWFVKQGLPVHLTREPTDGPVGSLLRLILARRVVNLPRRGERGTPQEAVLALLFAADRLDHLDNEILPRLGEGTYVISDRYYLSSLAYQTLDGGLELEWVRQVNSRCLRPDLTLFLDVPPAECKRRMEAQGRHVELYEELPKLELVRQSYWRVIEHLAAEGEAIRVVDGARPIEVVGGELVALVQPLVVSERIG